MKLRLVNLAILVFLIVTVCGCFSEAEEISVKTDSSIEAEIKKLKSKVTPEKNPKNADTSIESLLKEMTLEEKVGQMMMIGIYGKEMEPAISELMNNYKVGGIIFFDRNMDNQEQVKKFFH